ncbi:MAG: glycosyltransferase, partial [Pseudomonadota bacterium]
EELEREALLAASLEEELDASQQNAQREIDALEAKLEQTDRELTEWLELEVSRADSLEDELGKSRDTAKERIAELEEALARKNKEWAGLRSKEKEQHAKTGLVTGSTRKEEKPNSVSPAEKARVAIGNLHRRTASSLHTANERVAGQIAPAPEAEPIAWHRRLRGYQRPLPTQIFSIEWIAQQRPDLSDLTLRRYIAAPELRNLSPHPLFDAAGYLENYPDVAVSGLSPLAHYVLHGWREGRDPHPLFANDWYLSENPDVADEGNLNPLDHYLRYGWREGRRPNPLFDPRSYLDRYSDVEEGEFEPLSHFIMHGESEQRELAIRGLAQFSVSLEEAGGPLKLIRTLLHEPAPPAPAEEESDAVTGTAWPPEPLDDFWPAQEMREFISETHEEPLLARIWYLMSVMNRWRERQEEFAESEDCRSLLDRLRKRAALPRTEDSKAPAATIIIPVYNNVLDTLLCLSSLLELDEGYDFEVIIADDGSTDATADIIPTIGSTVRYLRQPENLGFLGNCNAAAREARGKNIILLNNDTLVFTGWLEGLLDPIENLSDVGFVGSKLLNWDGTLQEAGGIFWRDGSAWNFGRDQNARAPQFNYLKDVDYCSGASIAVPASIWKEVGGFDPIYTPAYCEDSDLAFRLREAGYRTLYNPASEVVHHEGRSHGRDVESGIKAYQVANTQKLLDRWQSVLERDHYPNAQNVLRARDRSFSKKHVLVIDHYVPQWDRDAGSRTLYQYMKIMIDDGFAVTFWPDNLWRDPVYTPQLQALGVEVISGPEFRGAFDGFIRERADLYDMVLVSRPHVAREYLGSIREASAATIVYYGHDLHFARMQAAVEKGHDIPAHEIEEMRELELSVCRASDVSLYPDPKEVKRIKDLIGSDKEFFANPVFLFSRDELAKTRAALPDIQSKPASDRLLFVGGFRHDPNIDGIIWFANEVMPILRERRPGVTLDIAGSNAPREVQELNGSDINVLGFISDGELEERYDECGVAVAPLRFGAGVKGKVIEAMALGIPVATTGVGAQGIEQADDALFLGDAPEELAAAIFAALENRNLAQRKACKALDFIERHYSEELMINFFRRLSGQAQ